MAFTYRETQIVKGMLSRGDKQHDIASYFGVNSGRVAEVATDQCDYPHAAPFPPEKLPPPGPYIGAKAVFEIREIIEEARDLVVVAGNDSDECKVALDALNAALARL